MQSLNQSASDKPGSLRSCLHIATLLAATIVLSGCAVVGPDYKAPGLTMPSRWSGADASQ